MLGLGRLSSAPPRTGRAPLTHPAPHDGYPESAKTEMYWHSGLLSLRFQHRVRVVLPWMTTIAWPPSLQQSYPASSVLCSPPTSHHRLNTSLFQIGSSYSNHDNSRLKSDRISRVALMTLCVARWENLQGLGRALEPVGGLQREVFIPSCPKATVRACEG